MADKLTFEANAASITLDHDEHGNVVVSFRYVQIPEEATNLLLQLRMNPAQMDEFADRLKAKAAEVPAVKTRQ